MCGRSKVLEEAHELERERGVRVKVLECRTLEEESSGHVVMRLRGRAGSNYDEEYAVMVQVGHDYPRELPRVRFLHHIHHALVSDLGLVPSEVIETSGCERNGHYSLAKLMEVCQGILDERDDVVPFPCTRRMRSLAQHYANANRLRLQWIEHLRENSQNPELYQRFPELQACWFDPVTYSAVQSGQREAILRLVQEECPGVYSFPLLSCQFCHLLSADIDTIPGARRPAGMMLRPPSSMQVEGIVLDDVGMEPLLMAMLEEILEKVSNVLYGVEQKSIVAHHGFILHSGPSNCSGIPTHKDEGELTFNTCITSGFKGGELYFYTPNASNPSRVEEKVVAPVLGRCIVYPGGKQHATCQTYRGIRRSLVLWCFRADHDVEAPLTAICPLEAYRVAVEERRQPYRGPLAARQNRFESGSTSDANSCADETTGMD
mmetsp:Transcript_2423/g.16309  ORF Transcript_2423/g.16309 Transcript_2423/m.16309 type:complete len:433 (-) Transcript_2423:2409-3707(-)